jgi:3-keto-L-gulonate-6-phosphate decarboxylase
MKMYFSYNIPDLSAALAIAAQTAEFSDILGVGSLLLLSEGIQAVKSFKAQFPTKDICVEARVSEKAREAITMMAQAGATYVSVLAGTWPATIKKATEIAHTYNIQIGLDLIDAPSGGQAALDAKAQGVDFLIMHRHSEIKEGSDFETDWHNIRDNSNIPIFITGSIDASHMQQIMDLKPQGIMIGSAITRSENPAHVARMLHALI